MSSIRRIFTKQSTNVTAPLISSQMFDSNQIKHNNRHTKYSLLPLIPLFFVLTVLQPGRSMGEDFPLPNAIRHNVLFWKKVYGTYSASQAVIHDAKDLSKVYTVIRQFDPALPHAAKLNDIAQKRAKKKYTSILIHLAKGAPATTSDEKRVAALFQGKNRRQRMLEAAENVRSQTGLKESFKSGVIKSGRYMKEMKRIFRSYRLPENLAYLPHVESSFQTYAYSKLGAAGIWQFTKNTGEQYLSINYAIDERLDPILSAHAAAKYFKSSFRTFNDWPLAITSYNYGVAGMLRAKNELGNYSNIFKRYSKGHFKFASRNFYSEFLAALYTAQRLEQELSARIEPALGSHYLALKSYISINDISTHFGCSIQTLKEYNPALRPSIFTGEKLIPKGYTLRLPAGNLRSKMATIPASSFKSTQRESIYHRVKKGETALKIASNYKISLHQLLQANNLSKSTTIYANQKLRIPKTAIIADKTKTFKSLNAKSFQHPPVTTLSDIKKQRPSESGYDYIPPKNPTIYNVFNLHKKDTSLCGYATLQPEEHLYLIAEWLETDLASLVSLNKLSPENARIPPGKQLLICFKQVSPDSFEERRLDHLQTTEEDFFSAFRIVGQKRYSVSPGDTIWNLCHKKFEIPLWLLERYNSTMNLAQLLPGQDLIIPLTTRL